jgi:glycosyltransferase involved in cell wall biosynthesis
MIDGVSLIICTYNGGLLLPPTIKHICKQETDNNINWEVLFINNASTDNTIEVIKSNWDSEIPMRIITENKKGLINARKKGLIEAKYNIVSFIDDDNWIEKNWINEVYTTFNNNPEIGICGSQNKAKYETLPPDWFKWIETSFAVGEQGTEFQDVTQSRGYVWGAGLSLRKDVYFSLIENGFSFFLTGRSGKELSAGEDTELCYAFILAGYQIWYNPQMKLTHYIPEKRLHWDKITGMFKGFGKAHAVLQIYDCFIKHNSGLAKLLTNNIKEYLLFKKNKTKAQLTNTVGNGVYLHYLFLREKNNHSFLKVAFLPNYYSIKKFSKSISK